MSQHPRPEPQVSVIIPTHNRRDLLRLTLRSALDQREVAFEVIVVDDGSTDDTQEELRSIEDPRLRVLRHERPEGVTAARNRGIEEARGAWVAFLDDDDLWAPNKLVRQLVATREADAEWAYTGAVIIDARQEVQGGVPPLPPETMMRLLPRWDPISGGCSGVIASRSALRDTGSFSPQFGTLADWELWLRLAERGVPAWVPRPLVGYRQHSGNMSLDVGRTMAELDLLEASHDLTVDRSRFDRYLASLCLRSGRKIDAIRLLLRAAFIDRTGYRLAEAKDDARMLWRFAVDGAARRLGLASPWWQRRRHARELRRDTHLQWKAEAQAWLDAISSPPADSASRSTQT